ncbi:hypothetical protein C8R43DRAFT_945123 [Mycena crocata]|nr:hypothetical protein C8R43DRAFT_945123 [Mycena crocata]
MSAGSAALEDAQAARMPQYPAWTTAFFFSEWSIEPELVRLPFDVATSDTRSPGNIDFDQWLDLFQDNVVNNDDYITKIPNKEGGQPHAFAVIHNSFDEATSEINRGVREHLGLHFVGRILILGLDASDRVVDLTVEDGPAVDRHLSSTVSLAVLFSVEIMGMILQLCPMATVAAFAGVTHRTAALVRDFIRSKIVSALAPFLPANAQTAFFALLKDTKGGIVGSVATALACCNILFARAHSPKDLNVLIPLGAFEVWNLWLESHNAERVLGIPRLRRYKKSVRLFAVYKVVAASGQTVYITVSESRTSSTLIPLLGSELTSQMTIVTPTHLVCLYSQFTPFLLAVSGWVRVASYEKRLTNFSYGGFAIGTTVEALGGRCGQACPFIWRRIQGPGFAEIAWGGPAGKDVGEANALRSENIRWRLGRMCDNLKCERFCSGFRF